MRKEFGLRDLLDDFWFSFKWRLHRLFKTQTYKNYTKTELMIKEIFGEKNE